MLDQGDNLHRNVYRAVACSAMMSADGLGSRETPLQSKLKRRTMNKSLSLILVTIPFIAAQCFGQSVASVALSTGTPSHSSANLTFSYTGSPAFFRVRIAVSPTTCTGGNGGYLVGTTSSPYSIRANPQQANVTGLSPSTAYQACPEITADGSNWFGGMGVTFTTLAPPSPHPALPVAPVSFNTSYPSTNGFTTYNLNNSCLDISTGKTLQQDLNLALSNQLKNGSIISITAGAVCRGQISLIQHAADTVAVNSSAVCASNSSGCTPNSLNIAHNFVEGDIAVFGSNYGAPPSPLIQGQNYFVHVLDASHFQLTFPLPYSMGGSIVPLSSQGAGTWYYYRRFNVTPGKNYGQRALNWIIIRPSTADVQFVPEHTRLQGPPDASGHPSAPTNWLPKMYTITMANNYSGFAAANQLFLLSNQDGNDESMNGYVRIVGARFTFDSSQDATGGEPIPHYGLVGSGQINSDFVVDRCWMDPPPHPDKNSGLLHFNGTNVAMVDSYSDNFDYYHPMTTGMALSVVNGNQFTIAPGKYVFGSGSVTLPSTVTVNTTGTSPSQRGYGWIYFDAAGTLNVTLPPGITPGSPACSGYSACRVYTLDTSQTSYYNVDSAGTPGFPNTPSSFSGASAIVEPVYSASSSCASTSTLLPSQWYSQATEGIALNYAPNTTVDTGIRVLTDTVPGYFCGIQFYKPVQDTMSTHTVTLWSDTGSVLVQTTSSSEPSSGKVYVPFATPYLANASKYYRVSYKYYQYAVGWGYSLQNFDPNGSLVGNVHSSQYVTSNTSYNINDNWPKTMSNRPSVAPFAVVGFGSGGLDGGVAMYDTYTDGFNTEGCQCMVSGLGPGPFLFLDNYTIGSGNVWHFDDSGGYTMSRHDYTLTRNWFYAPLTNMFTADASNTVSDGMRHGHRHSVEWKQGNCGALVGNIFDTSWVEDTPFGDLFEIGAVNGAYGMCGVTNQIIYGGASDFDLRSNTFMHAAAVASDFGMNSPSPAAVAQRFRFTNNLLVDISGTAYCADGAGFCSSHSYGSGLIFQPRELEDFTMTHNTMVGNNGGSRLPFVFLASVNNLEGFNVRDNILWINGINNGLDGTQNDTCGFTNGTDTNCWGGGTWCKALAGIAAFNCAYVNSTWINNLMTGSPSQAQIQSLWPNNVVPGNPSNLASVGWSYYTSASVMGNYNLTSTSPYISGGSRPASDGLNIGVNYDQLQVDQGYVTLSGVSNITRTSAQINFVAPDAQACPVDYSPSDPTVTDGSLVRITDTGTSRVRNISITGLTNQKTYYFRVNCAVNQPMGQFKTH